MSLLHLIGIPSVQSFGEHSCSDPNGWVGDSWCDDHLNHRFCGWDGGDCCGPNVKTTECTDCLCLDPSKTCLQTMNWTDYQSYRTIDTFISCLANAYPDQTKLINIGNR